MFPLNKNILYTFDKSLYDRVAAISKKLPVITGLPVSILLLGLEIPERGSVGDERIVETP